MTLNFRLGTVIYRSFSPSFQCIHHFLITFGLLRTESSPAGRLFIGLFPSAILCKYTIAVSNFFISTDSIKSPLLSIYLVLTLTFFPENAIPNFKIFIIPSSFISQSYLNSSIYANALSAKLSRASSPKSFSHFNSNMIPGYLFSLGIKQTSYLPSPDSLLDLILY